MFPSQLTQDLRVEAYMITHSVRFISRQADVMTDQLRCHNQIILTMQSLLPRVFDDFCKVCEGLMVDLFLTRRNQKLPIHVPPVSDPMAWNEDAFQHSWDHLEEYAISVCRDKIMMSEGLTAILVAPLCHTCYPCW